MVAPLAILDSDVLFGVISMDVLMSLGVAAIYEPHWSEEILFAAERNILKVRPNVEPSRLRSRFEDMDDALPDALVEVPTGLAHSVGDARKLNTFAGRKVNTIAESSPALRRR